MAGILQECKKCNHQINGYKIPYSSNIDWMHYIKYAGKKRGKRTHHCLICDCQNPQPKKEREYDMRKTIEKYNPMKGAKKIPIIPQMFCDENKDGDLMSCKTCEGEFRLERIPVEYDPISCPYCGDENIEVIAKGEEE